MKPFLAYLAVVYLLMALFLLNNWLGRYREAGQMTPEERSLSLLTLVVAAIFWPIAVPIAYLELLEKQKSNQAEPLPKASVSPGKKNSKPLMAEWKRQDGE